jgi:hypothetical protein
VRDGKKLAYYFGRDSPSLQKITFAQTGRFFHDGDGKPVKGIYLCPLCLKNKIGMVGEHLHFDEEFTLDHYPPKSVGGS